MNPNLIPIIRGRRVALRPIEPKDYDFLYRLEIALEMSGSWRYRGRTPSPEDVIRDLWHSVLVQFIAVNPNDGEPLGLVRAYDANFDHGHIAITVMGPRQGPNASPLLDASVLLMDHVFNSWTFRKMYGYTVGTNLAAFASANERLFVEEGRLRDHVFLNGGYHDFVTLALYREDWMRAAPRVLAYVKGTAALGVGRNDLTFEEFAKTAAVECQLRIVPVDRSQTLIDDLEFDSLTLFAVAEYLHEVYGVVLQDALLPELRTFGDIYHYYETLSAGR